MTDCRGIIDNQDILVFLHDVSDKLAGGLEYMNTAH